MKKYLLPNTNSYKANLHCHSTISDGVWTPEQIKEEYQKRGYSIVAYTDHSMMIDHHKKLSDDKFLALRGYEAGIAQAAKDKTTKTIRTCHICVIALDPDNLVQPCYNQKGIDHWKHYNKPAVDWVIYDKEKPEFEFFYSPEVISRFMEECRKEGFFVTYNHPAWSLETRDQYTNYHGMHAMEICNYGCYSSGYEDYNAYIYDDMLRAGERIYCIATDDNHNGGEGEDAFHDSFGGFTMICAESLDYRTVTRALENGEFYASMGPEIYELYLEDDAVHIKCSPARTIALHGGVRVSWAKHAKGDELLTEATFPLYGLDLRYFRLSVTDKEGKRANTNAYFTDTL